MNPATETAPPRSSGLDTLPAQVRAIVGSILGISPDLATGSAALVADLGATSLDFVELVMAVEDTFGVDIPDAEADRLITVDDLVALIVRERAQR